MLTTCAARLVALKARRKKRGNPVAIAKAATVHRKVDLRSRSRRRDTAFIHPSRTVDWNRRVKPSVGPKFYGKIESMVSPAILGAQPWFHGLWPGRHVGLKLSRLPSEQFPSYQKLTRREPRRLPSCDIALHLERADALVPDRYGSKYLTSSQLHPGSGLLVQTGCLPSGLEGAGRSGTPGLMTLRPQVKPVEDAALLWQLGLQCFSLLEYLLFPFSGSWRRIASRNGV